MRWFRDRSSGSRRARRRVVALLLGAVVAACASGPPPHPDPHGGAPRNEPDPRALGQCTVVQDEVSSVPESSGGEAHDGSAADASDAEGRGRWSIQTGDPIPEDAGDPPADGVVRWLATDPHVPFVRAGDGGVAQHGADACTRWAIVGSRWHEVDAYGRVVGEVELTGGEGYDATQCYELRFRRVSGRKGVGLLVSEGYEPPADVAAWEPDARARRALDKLVRRVDALFPHEGAGALPDPSERVLYYERPDDARRGGHSRHWAVAGGRALVVASLERDGSWRIRHMENRYSVEGFGPPVPYRPVAVIDLAGSGDPAVVYHESAGAGWNDVLLEPRGMVYERTAESVSGGTV